MNKVWIIVRKEYLERVRSRSFLLVTLLVPLLVGLVILVLYAGMGIAALVSFAMLGLVEMKLFEDQKDSIKLSSFVSNVIDKETQDKIDIIKSLDLLVIDEISMVRADLLDAIDDVLRRFRDHGRPFGGVQLLMVGDLHQLPPVVKQEDWDVLSRFYETPYFFGSRALGQTDYISIELKHIYRQSDSRFGSLVYSIAATVNCSRVTSSVRSSPDCSSLTRR